MFEIIDNVQKNPKEIIVVPHDYEGSMKTKDVYVVVYITEDESEEYYCFDKSFTITNVKNDKLLYTDVETYDFDNEKGSRKYNFEPIMSDVRIITSKYINDYEFNTYGPFYKNVIFDAYYTTGSLSFVARIVVFKLKQFFVLFIFLSYQKIKIFSCIQ